VCVLGDNIFCVCVLGDNIFFMCVLGIFKMNIAPSGSSSDCFGVPKVCLWMPYTM
jgi:hypothetical protein